MPPKTQLLSEMKLTHKTAALEQNFKTLVQLVIEAEMKGTPRNELVLELGATPKLLIDLGFPELPLIIKATTIGKICFDHGINTGTIERLPKLVNSPSHVFKSNSQYVADKSAILITVEFKNFNPIIIAIHKHKKVGRSLVNEVVSMYAKEGPNPIDKWTKDGLLMWEMGKK